MYAPSKEHSLKPGGMKGLPCSILLDPPPVMLSLALFGLSPSVSLWSQAFLLDIEATGL